MLPLTKQLIQWRGTILYTGVLSRTQLKLHHTEQDREGTGQTRLDWKTRLTKKTALWFSHRLLLLLAQEPHLAVGEHQVPGVPGHLLFVRVAARHPGSRGTPQVWEKSKKQMHRSIVRNSLRVSGEKRRHSLQLLHHPAEMNANRGGRGPEIRLT